MYDITKPFIQSFARFLAPFYLLQIVLLVILNFYVILQNFSYHLIHQLQVQFAHKNV